jgi:hypothetical protein
MCRGGAESRGAAEQGQDRTEEVPNRGRAEELAQSLQVANPRCKSPSPGESCCGGGRNVNLSRCGGEEIAPFIQWHEAGKYM